MTRWMDLFDKIDLVDISQLYMSPLEKRDKQKIFKKYFRLEFTGRYDFSYRPQKPLSKYSLSSHQIVKKSFIGNLLYISKYNNYNSYVYYNLLKYLDINYLYDSNSRKLYYYFLKVILYYETYLFSKMSFIENLMSLRQDSILLIKLECLKKHAIIYNFQWNDFEIQDDSEPVLLYEDFILRVPLSHLSHLGEYSESYRRFKYHEYLTYTSVNSINLKKFLLDLDVYQTDDATYDFVQSLISNKIIFFNVQHWTEHNRVYMTSNINNFLLFKKLYAYIIHHLSYFSIYENLLKDLGWFVKIYSYKMCYSSKFDWLIYFKNFPRGKRFSLEYFFHRLYISQVDIFAFTANYFILDCLKSVNFDLGSSLWNVKSNLIGDISISNYLRYGMLLILDYTARRTYEYVNYLSAQMEDISGDLRKEFPMTAIWRKYLAYWLLFSDLYTTRGYHYTELNNLWENCYLENKVLYLRKSLDIIMWDIYRLKAYNYIYNFYSIGDYTYYNIDKFHNDIFLFIYDIFLIYFLKNIKCQDTSKMSLFFFYNDLSTKVFYTNNSLYKYSAMNRNLSYKFSLFIISKLFNRVWFNQKRRKNFYLFFWNNIYMYYDFDIQFSRLIFVNWDSPKYINRNYKTYLLTILFSERFPFNVDILYKYFDMIHDRIIICNDLHEEVDSYTRKPTGDYKYLDRHFPDLYQKSVILYDDPDEELPQNVYYIWDYPTENELKFFSSYRDHVKEVLTVPNQVYVIFFGLFGARNLRREGPTIVYLCCIIGIVYYDDTRIRWNDPKKKKKKKKKKKELNEEII